MSYPAPFTMLKRGYGVSDAAHAVQKYPLGATFTDEHGNKYVYAKTASNVSISQYYLCLLLADGAQMLTTTLAATKAKCGIPMVAVTAGGSGVYQYLWFLVETGVGQTASVRIAASCAANVPLFPTETAGEIDDTYVANCQIDGIVLQTAAAAAAAEINTTAVLSNPTVLIASVAVDGTEIAEGAISLEHLDAGITPAYIIVAAGKHTTAGGDANETITATGAVAGDIAIASLIAVGDNPTTILTAIAATDAVNVVMSANPSTDHVIGWMVIRAAA